MWLILIMMGKKIIEFKSNFFVFFCDFCRLDDLLVGAPLYTIKKDGRIIADAGRVDIFLQTPEVCFFLY